VAVRDAPDDFAQFYLAAYRRLLRQLFAVTGDLAEAEDLLQEAFARASVRWATVRGYDNPEAWVRRVALNLAGMAAKRMRRRALALLRLGPPPALPDLTPDALDLYRALRSLPMAQRQAIVLHHLVGLPVDQVAAELRVPSGTVKARLARGRAVLAARLSPEFEEAVRS
jgi:RNA polymerase sigma-70 factor, ECF subfamily